MLNRRPRQVLLSLGAFITLGLSSCGVSVVEQCNSFSEVINQGEEFQKEFETEMEAFAENFSSGGEEGNELENLKNTAQGYIDVVSKVVAKIDEMTTELRALELPDETLTEYRDNYADVTAQFSEALTQTSDAMALLKDVESEEDLMGTMGEFQEKAMGAFESLDALSQQSDELTTDINSYCEEAAS